MIGILDRLHHYAVWRWFLSSLPAVAVLLLVLAAAMLARSLILRRRSRSSSAATGLRQRPEFRLDLVDRQPRTDYATLTIFDSIYKFSKPAKITLGRDPGNDIVLNYPTISLHHAEIHYGTGHFLLRDLRSTNGIRVNGVEALEAMIKDGDFVEIAKVGWRVRIILPDFESTDGMRVKGLGTSSRVTKDGDPIEPAGVGSIPNRTMARSLPGHLNQSDDRVHFSVTAPSSVAPGSSFELYIWAHLDEQRDAVVERTRAATGREDVLTKSKGPVRVTRGTEIQVRLKIDGELTVGSEEEQIFWDGEPGNACFVVSVPTESPLGYRSGVAIFQVGGMQIARLHFVLAIENKLSGRAVLRANEQQIRRAFASYASMDRNEVLGRIQGIQKVAPAMEIFLDVLALRSGQNWEADLWRVIPQSDVFYLFWSGNAMKSPWVEKEWRCALRTRGLAFIDPVPLVPPTEAPPPPELAGKHFNDWILAFMKVRPDTVDE